jgi:hypothetical protein
VELSQDGSVVTIKLPVETLFMENIGTIRARIADDIGNRFTNINKVVFIDEIEVKREAEEKKAETKPEEQPQQQPQ